MGRHDQETITRALVALVQHGGAVPAAHRALKQQGVAISTETLKRWRDETHAAEYRKLAARYGDELEKQIVAESQVAAAEALDVLLLAVAKTREQLENKNVYQRDSSLMAKNLAAVMQATSREFLSLTGRATDRLEVVDMEKEIKALARDLNLAQPTPAGQ